MYVFTSFGFRSPIVREKLEGVIDPSGKTVLVLPFAAYDPSVCAPLERDGLKLFGFEEDKITVCQGASDLDGYYDYIYVPGGETFKLLYTVQSRGLAEGVKRLISRGAVYVGVSAGAELATKNLEYVKNLEDNNYPLNDFSGLGLVNRIIIPHSDQRSLAIIASCATNNGEVPLCIRNDGVAVCTQDGETTII